MANIQIPAGPSGQGVIPLPKIPNRIYGRFMNDNLIQTLCKPIDSRRLMFAHNKIFSERIPEVTMTMWTHLLYNSRPHAVVIEYNEKQWRCYGSSPAAVCCFELHGVLMPSEWYAPDVVSNRATFEILKSYNSALIGTATQIEQITQEQWQAIANDLATASSSTTTVNHSIDSACTVLYSICRTGSASRSTQTKLKDEITKNLSADITLDDQVVAEYWNYLGKHYNMEMISSLMTSLLSYFKSQEVVRLRNLVVFAKRRNLTQYYAVLDAITKCSDFPWEKVMLRAPSEFENFAKAREIIQDRDYYGYNPDLSDVAAGNYPTLAYISIQLVRRKLGQSELEHFKTSVGSKINRTMWDTLIDAYVDQRATMFDESEIDRVKPQLRKYVNNIRKGFYHKMFKQTVELIDQRSSTDDSSDDDQQGPSDPRPPRPGRFSPGDDSSQGPSGPSFPDEGDDQVPGQSKTPKRQGRKKKREDASGKSDGGGSSRTYYTRSAQKGQTSQQPSTSQLSTIDELTPITSDHWASMAHGQKETWLKARDLLASHAPPLIPTSDSIGKVLVRPLDNSFPAVEKPVMQLVAFPNMLCYIGGLEKPTFVMHKDPVLTPINSTFFRGQPGDSGLPLTKLIIPGREKPSISVTPGKVLGKNTVPYNELLTYLNRIADESLVIVCRSLVYAISFLASDEVFPYLHSEIQTMISTTLSNCVPEAVKTEFRNAIAERRGVDISALNPPPDSMDVTH